MKKHFGDERDSMENPKCSMPPRTREGKLYAGGKQLRKRMTKLGIRKANFVPEMPNAKRTKCTMPGSLKA